MVEKIVLIGKSRGLNQQQIEAAVGLSSGRISKWKDGIGEPTASQALDLARALNVPVEFLIDESLEQLPSPDFTDDEIKILEYVRLTNLSYGEFLRTTRGQHPATIPQSNSGIAPFFIGKDLRPHQPTQKELIPIAPPEPQATISPARDVNTGEALPPPSDHPHKRKSSQRR